MVETAKAENAPEEKDFVYEVTSKNEACPGRYDVTLRVVRTDDEQHAKVQLFIAPTDDGNNPAITGSMASKAVKLRELLFSALRNKLVSGLDSDRKHPTFYAPTSPAATYKAIEGFGPTVGAVPTLIRTPAPLGMYLFFQDKKHKEKELSWQEQAAQSKQTVPSAAEPVTADTPDDMRAFDGAVFQRFSGIAEFDDKKKRLATSIAATMDDFKIDTQNKRDAADKTPQALRARNRIAAGLKRIMGAAEDEAQKLANLYMKTECGMDTGEMVAVPEAKAAIAAAPAPTHAQKVKPQKFEPTKLRMALIKAIEETCFPEVSKGGPAYDRPTYDRAIDGVFKILKEPMSAYGPIDISDIKEAIDKCLREVFPKRSESRYEQSVSIVLKAAERSQQQPPKSPPAR